MKVFKHRLALPKAKKSLGQHFLTDDRVVDSLISMMQISPNDTVIEIGPGPGILTRALAQVCKQVIAIELDTDMVDYLSRHLKAPNVKVHHGDILKTDLIALMGDPTPHPLHIASNLPYQISSPFLFYLVKYVPHITEIGLMLQKEVVDRMAALPGSRLYGRLSVMVQFYFQTTRGSTVPPNAFYPPPRVDSALITLTPKRLSTEEQDLAQTLENVVKQAFSQRRKTLKNTLKSLCSVHELTDLGIAPNARAECISLAQFVTLAQAVRDKYRKIEAPQRGDH